MFLKTYPSHKLVSSITTAFLLFESYLTPGSQPKKKVIEFFFLQNSVKTFVDKFEKNCLNVMYVKSEFLCSMKKLVLWIIAYIVGFVQAAVK